MPIAFWYTSIVDRARQKTSLELKDARIWSRAHELKIIADSTVATCMEFKKVFMEVDIMFYDMIQEFGKDFIGEWFMFSAMAIAGSVLIIACNIAGKF